LLANRTYSNELIVSKRGINKYIFFSLAILSFFPSFVFQLAFLFVLGFVFRSAGLKFLLFCLCLSVLAVASMLLQQDFYYKGIIVTTAFFLPFLICFLLLEKKERGDWCVFFMKAHIFISLIQIPIQIFQFISIYGFDLGLLLTNSSVGDASFGTLSHSFVLAEKQLMSIFFLVSLRKNFSNFSFLIYLLALGGSFLFIGANTSTLVLLTAIAIYYFILSNLGLFKLTYVWKRIGIGFLLLLTVLLVNKYLFTNQHDHISNALNAIVERGTSVSKLKVYDSIVEIFSNNPEYLLVGLGAGHYSSRVSFILSGEYLTEGIHPLLGFQNNPRFDEYLRPLWNDSFRFDVHSNNTFYQPFSSILTVISEYGIFIFAYFLLILLRVYNRISLGIGKVFILFVAGMLFVDNIIEYPRICLPVSIYILYLLNESKTYKAKEMAAPQGMSTQAADF
jgi:hypothetical protein